MAHNPALLLRSAYAFHVQQGAVGLVCSHVQLAELAWRPCGYRPFWGF
jgi:hypothetical protein